MEAFLLSKEETKDLESVLPEWKISQISIERNFKFNNFIDAFAFMTKVALICEKFNHHPNWENIYSSVNIKLTTHDLGGISNLDKLLAAEINNLSEDYL